MGLHLPTKCDFCGSEATILLTLQSGAVICSRCRREDDDKPTSGAAKQAPARTSGQRPLFDEGK